MSERTKNTLLVITVAIAIISGLVRRRDNIPMQRSHPEFRHTVPLRDEAAPTPTPQLIVEIRQLLEK